MQENDSGVLLHNSKRHERIAADRGSQSHSCIRSVSDTARVRQKRGYDDLSLFSSRLSARKSGYDRPTDRPSQVRRSK
jgi:hypothetical protein